MVSKIDKLIEADITDPTLSDWMGLVDPEDELDWEEWEDQARYCNKLYLYWKSLSPDQKEVADRFTEVFWRWEFSKFIKYVNHRLQIEEEVRAYTAPLQEYEEDWSDAET